MVVASSTTPSAEVETRVKPGLRGAVVWGVLQPQKGATWKYSQPPSAMPSGPAV